MTDVLLLCAMHAVVAALDWVWDNVVGLPRARKEIAPAPENSSSFRPSITRRKY
jgi:hypothetical protein